MTLLPFVRHMILCQDWGVDDRASLLINVRGLLTSIRSVEHPAYPLEYEEVCVLIFLTECRGTAEVLLACIDEESERVIYKSERHEIQIGHDPLAVIIFPFRVRGVRFSHPGVYRFELWYNGDALAEQTLRLR